MASIIEIPVDTIRREVATLRKEMSREARNSGIRTRDILWDEPTIHPCPYGIRVTVTGSAPHGASLKSSILL